MPRRCALVVTAAAALCLTTSAVPVTDPGLAAAAEAFGQLGEILAELSETEPVHAESESESSSSSSTETFYKIEKGVCGQADCPSKYASYAKQYGGLKKGTCKKAGYTTPAQPPSQKITVPVLGKVTVKRYVK